MKILIFTSFVILLISACSKNKESFEYARENMAGIYTVTSIHKTEYDTLGKIIKESTVDNPGTINLAISDPLNVVLFDKVFCTNSITFQYFQNHIAIDDAGDQYSIYWDADPAGMRVFLWGIGVGKSYHLILNRQEVDKNSEKWIYVESYDAYESNSGHIKRMEELTLER